VQKLHSFFQPPRLLPSTLSRFYARGARSLSLLESLRTTTCAHVRARARIQQKRHRRQPPRPCFQPEIRAQTTDDLHDVADAPLRAATANQRTQTHTHTQTHTQHHHQHHHEARKSRSCSLAAFRARSTRSSLRPHRSTAAPVARDCRRTDLHQFVRLFDCHKLQNITLVLFVCPCVNAIESNVLTPAFYLALLAPRRSLPRKKHSFYHHFLFLPPCSFHILCLNTITIITIIIIIIISIIDDINKQKF